MNTISFLKSDIQKKAEWVYGKVSFKNILKTLLTDGTFAMFAYRSMQSCQRLRLYPLAMFFNKLNAFFGRCIIGRNADFGEGFVLVHSYGVVINSSVKGGKNIVIEHLVTIGAEKNESPVLGDNVFIGAGAKVIGAVRSIYHCVDLWSGFGMYDNILMDKLDEECCRNADVVVASSHALYEACSRRNPRTYEVMHGVDHDHFSSAIDTPKALSEAEGRKVIGFVGLISEWVDQDLLVSLARRFKDDKIVLIGNADVDCSRLKAEANIIMTGPKPYADIPSYVSAFTVGIIPFKVNNLTRAVNPIKLREMMAAGCPVVSTDLPEVSRYLHQKGGFSDYVSLARNTEQFVTDVSGFIEKPIPRAKKQELSSRMALESWSAVTNMLTQIIKRENENV